MLIIYFMFKTKDFDCVGLKMDWSTVEKQENTLDFPFFLVVAEFKYFPLKDNINLLSSVTKDFQFREFWLARGIARTVEKSEKNLWRI